MINKATEVLADEFPEVRKMCPFVRRFKIQAEHLPRQARDSRDREDSKIVGGFSQLAIEVIQPSEQDKRHGQAIAAGSLPALPR